MDTAAPAAPVAASNGLSPNALLAAICALTGGALLAIVLIELFRSGDNTSLITTIVGLTIPTILALKALLMARQGDQLQGIQVAVNGRLSELLRQTAEAERAKGRVEGIMPAASPSDPGPSKG